LADAEKHAPRERTRKAYTQTSKTFRGRQQKQRKVWFTTDIWQAIKNRKALKKKIMDTRSERLKERDRQQYLETDQAVKRMVRADKRAYIEDLANQAEEAANKGEQGQVCKITKLVSGKYHGTTDTPIVDKQGRLLTMEAEKEARWAEHFTEVLNRPPPTTEAEVQHPGNDLDVSIAPPEKEEIMAAIRSLKNRKSQNPKDRTASMQNSSKQS